MHIRTLHLTLVLLTQLTFISAPALAATKSKLAITDFQVEEVDRLRPGVDLNFSLHGTAGGKATVSITGVSRTIVLDEVDDGQYEGQYTVRTRDKLRPDTTVKARLKKNGRSVRATLDEPLATDDGNRSDRDYYDNPDHRSDHRSDRHSDSSYNDSDRANLNIERLTVRQVDSIEPGTDLDFRLSGTPNSRATLNIEGVTSDLPMTETVPGSGVYEGRYTVRRQDNFPSDVKVSATLGRGPGAVSKRLDQPMVNDSAAPAITGFSPQNNETVSADSQNNSFISARFDDKRGSGIDPRSVKVLVDDRDVTNDSVITNSFFSYQPTPPLGRGSHEVKVSARDKTGNSIRVSWNFQVSEGRSGRRSDRRQGEFVQ